MTGTRHILAALNQHGPLTAIQLTEYVSGWTSQTSRDLRRLETQGYVQRLGDGHWQATPPGQPATHGATVHGAVWAKAGRRGADSSNGQRKFHAWHGNLALCGKIAAYAPKKFRAIQPRNACKLCVIASHAAESTTEAVPA